MNALAFEEEQINLQLEEIRLRKRLNEIKREQYERKKHAKTRMEQVIKNTVTNTSTLQIQKNKPTILNYSPSSKKRCMRIADINKDGCILIYGSKGTKHIAKKYTMKSLIWIQKKLPTWVQRQKTEANFWDNLAEQYTKKFQVKISDNTMQRLCYLVDSGKADEWFLKYNDLRNNGVQGTLDGGRL